MPQLTATTVIPAPRLLVAGLLRDRETAQEALRRAGHDFEAAVPLLVAGDEVCSGARVAPGLRLRFHTRIRCVGAEGMVSELAGGPAAGLTHRARLCDVGEGTALHDEIEWVSPLGALGRIADAVRVRRLLDDVLAARAEVLRERAVALAAGPVIVGAAIVRGDAVLAAQRARPAALRGRWEVPGGRVEPGEAEPDAVVRECREELGADVVVGPRIGTDLPVPAGVLRVYTARLAPGSPEPVALEHLELRWVRRAEIAGLGWVDADRALVADLLRLLRA